MRRHELGDRLQVRIQQVDQTRLGQARIRRQIGLRGDQPREIHARDVRGSDRQAQPRFIHERRRDRVRLVEGESQLHSRCVDAEYRRQEHSLRRRDISYERDVLFGESDIGRGHDGKGGDQREQHHPQGLQFHPAGE